MLGLKAYTTTARLLFLFYHYCCIPARRRISNSRTTSTVNPVEGQPVLLQILSLGKKKKSFRRAGCVGARFNPSTEAVEAGRSSGFGVILGCIQRPCFQNRLTNKRKSVIKIQARFCRNKSVAPRVTFSSFSQRCQIT